MSAILIRPEEAGDEAAIFALVERAFGRPDEALLVDALRRDGDVVLSLAADRDGAILGHVLFSRLAVQDGASQFAAVALAPVAVDPAHRRKAIGSRLIEEAHGRLRVLGETLSVVVGDPAYYGRFGYTNHRASAFESDYQGEYLQALAWGDAPSAGPLVYPPAFGAL